MNENLGRDGISQRAAKDIEHVYREWDRAWSTDDLEAMLALYAEDATLESPLIPHLTGGDRGICRGRSEIRKLLEMGAPRKPRKRTFHRKGYFTDGRTLVWEYPRATPDGEQMDFFEVMEVEGGLIRKHRVYWGWRGFEVIKADAYQKET
jgi:ketosteroid isomerase-like protein